MPRHLIKSALLALSLIALALPARAQPAPAADTFTPAQKAAVEKIVHDYVIEHPEVLVEWQEAYNKHMDDAEKKNFNDNVGKYKDFLTDASTPFGGNPNGKHVIVEFFDYNCGWCKRGVDNVVALIKADPQAKVYFKDFPILSPTSSDAAKWALAAAKQGKYFEFHVALLHNTHPRDRQTYLEAAKQVPGLDPVKLEKDAKDPGFDAILAKNLSVAHDLGISGTPSFIFGTTLFPGYMSLPKMQEADAQIFGGSGGGSAPAP